VPASSGTQTMGYKFSYPYVVPKGYRRGAVGGAGFQGLSVGVSSARPPAWSQLMKFRSRPTSWCWEVPEERDRAIRDKAHGMGGRQGRTMSWITDNGQATVMKLSPGRQAA